MLNYHNSQQNANGGFLPFKTTCPCGKSESFTAYKDNPQAGTCWKPTCTQGVLNKDGASRTVNFATNVRSASKPFTQQYNTPQGNVALMPQPTQPEKPKPAHYAFIEKYIYTDENDVPLFDVHRKEGRNKDGSVFIGEDGFKKKSFPQYKTGTYDAIGETRRVLYRLPKVLKAIQEGKTVYIVEGEKDVHSLEQCGLVATCNAGGAGKWIPDYSETLRAANVVILPDNDEAGKHHAELIVNSILGIAASVKVVSLRNLPPKGDVTDFFNNGGTLEQLLEEVEHCQHCQDCQSLDSHSLGNLTFTTWQETNEVLKKAEWIWRGYLAKGYVTMFASYAGSGKSFFILWLVWLFTSGKSFPDGTTVEEAGKVLWIETEFGHALHMERGAAFGIDNSNIINPLENPLDTVSLENPQHREKIRAFAACKEVKLIVLDSLSGSHNLQENDTGVKVILSFLAELARDFNKPVIVTHHLNKSLHDDKPNLNRVRGSSAITQYCRVICAIDKPSEENPNRKRLSVIKSNLGLVPQDIGFEIEEEEIIFTVAPEAPKPKTQLNIAYDFLLEFLKSGEKPQAEIVEAANLNGIKERTLNRAKKPLQVRSRKEYDSISRESKWYWSLQDSTEKQDCQTEESVLFGNVGNVGNLAFKDEQNSEATPETSLQLTEAELLAALPAQDSQIHRTQLTDLLQSSRSILSASDTWPIINESIAAGIIQEFGAGYLKRPLQW